MNHVGVTFDSHLSSIVEPLGNGHHDVTAPCSQDIGIITQTVQPIMKKRENTWEQWLNERDPLRQCGLREKRNRQNYPGSVRAPPMLLTIDTLLSPDSVSPIAPTLGPLCYLTDLIYYMSTTNSAASEREVKL